ILRDAARQPRQLGQRPGRRIARKAHYCIVVLRGYVDMPVVRAHRHPTRPQQAMAVCAETSRACLADAARRTAELRQRPNRRVPRKDPPRTPPPCAEAAVFAIGAPRDRAEPHQRRTISTNPSTARLGYTAPPPT